MKWIKWAAFIKLNLKYKVDLVCLQETKKDNFTKLICQNIWGDFNVSWDSVPSVHTVGGLLCMWNNSDFEVDRRVKGRNFLMLVGTWIKDNLKLFIVNVYAPCHLAGKRDLWEELRQLKASNPEGLWCFLRDFNSIRSQDERTGSSQRSVGTYDSSGFNDWISDMEIQEIKSFGSRFTWCRPNGSVRSRLDRCLVSEHWLLKWPDSSHQVLHRDYSDHYPIILKTKLVDWGPKPFRVMDCWPKNKEYQRLVKEVWCGDQQLGWGSIVLKNKLRNLKSSLKQWSIENGDVNNNKIQQLIYLSSIFIYS